ncbi:MAG: hypothetical protein ACK5Y6_01280, partial [Pseudomonadota bacterium]
REPRRLSASGTRFYLVLQLFHRKLPVRLAAWSIHVGPQAALEIVGVYRRGSTEGGRASPIRGR